MNRPLLETIIEIIDKNDFKQTTPDYKSIIHIDEDLALLITFNELTFMQQYKVNIIIKKESFYYNLLEILNPLINEVLKKEIDKTYHNTLKRLDQAEIGIAYHDIYAYIYDLFEVDSELIHTEEPFLLIGGNTYTATEPENSQGLEKDQNGNWVIPEKTIFLNTDIPYWKSFSNTFDSDPLFQEEELVGIFIKLTLS